MSLERRDRSTLFHPLLILSELGCVGGWHPGAMTFSVQFVTQPTQLPTARGQNYCQLHLLLFDYDKDKSN